MGTTPETQNHSFNPLAAGIIFATASATLAVSCLVYDHGHPNPRFAIFYPLLWNMSRCGVLTSFAAILFSVLSVWRQSSLRWLRPFVR